LDTGIIDHLYTPLGTTSNYSAIANLHNLQITTAPLKLFPACCVFNSLSLATASNSGDSSVSRAHPAMNSCQLSTQLQRHFFSTFLAELDTTNWVPGWRPFHTNILVFSSQAGFQLTTEQVNLIVFKITPRREQQRNTALLLLRAC
jgi:hypothetical protein